MTSLPFSRVTFVVRLCELGFGFWLAIASASGLSLWAGMPWAGGGLGDKPPGSMRIVDVKHYSETH
jgi:hypothetical protein